MKRQELLLLFVVSMAVVVGALAAQIPPDYMDAQYYAVTGASLAQGSGFNEWFLWNYLDDPHGLPHPSHAYWMPLASIVSALGMILSRSVNITAGRLAFIIIAACIPSLTATLSFRLNGRQDLARLSGWLGMFPAFYLPFLPVTDTFGIYMLLGSLWLLQAERCTHTVEGQPHEPSLIKKVYNGSQPFVLGILAGLMHLARADGLIWAGMTGVCILWGNKIQDWRKYTANLILSSFGYLLIMAPWLARNWVTFGTLLAPGAGRTLWMTGYNDLYLYPASLLTMERWLENGLTAVVQARTWALGQNLQTLLAVQGEIFLLPFIIWGLWHLRRLRLVRLGVLAWLFTFLVMTFVFPFAGARGGFFHSGAALQPFIFALVPSGLEQAITWAARKRGWLVGQAQRVFQLGALILAIFLTIVVAARRIDSAQTPGDPERYLRIESALVSLGASPDAIIMVNNPPGYYLSVGRPAIVIPSGDLGMVQAAARNYHSKYLLLEFNQLTGSDDLYGKPGDRAGLDYLTTVEDVRIYEFNEDVVP